MKIYYFNHSQMEVIVRKVIDQCNYLIESGLDAHLFLVEPREFEIPNKDFISIIKLSDLNHNPWKNVLLRLKRQYELRKAFLNTINSASSSDIVYVRYPCPLFYLIWPFSIQKRMCKIINEHNTIEHQEYRLKGASFTYFIDFLMGNLMRRKADGIIGVTNEITTYEIRRSGNDDKPNITIGNGIDVSKVKIRKPPIFDGKKLDLLCVANVSRWHGIDRLLEGLAIYKGNTKVRFFLVGDGQDLPNLKLMVKKIGVDKNVIITGDLKGSALDDLFETSHIAVGSLGLHRMNMKEGSILKAREYCARGIPFLYGCSDPDFPDDFPYVQKVPGDESAINVEEVIRFAEKVYSDPEHHIKMRAYAEENLDWPVKMKKLKEFCETLIDG